MSAGVPAPAIDVPASTPDPSDSPDSPRAAGVPGVPGSSALESTRRPPIAELAVVSMGLVIVAGIYLASYLPVRAPLPPAVALVAVSGALLVAEVALVSRLRPFAWEIFFRVARWALLAYLIIAGMLEYVFLLDHTRGPMLVLLTLSLAVFAVDIPLLLAFSVARYQDPAQGVAQMSPGPAAPS